MSDSEYKDKSDQIRQLSSLPPDQFMSQLVSQHPNVQEGAPNIAPHFHAAANNAVQFLNSKLPSAGNELLQDRHRGASTAHKRSWLDMHNTVSDPLSVLDKVENGTVNSNHLQALQSVYPDLHQEMIGKMKEHLGQFKLDGKQLPYKKRLAISKFIGEPLDSTMTPQSAQAIIAAAGANTGPAAQANANKKATEAQLNQINKTNNIYATPDQKKGLSTEA